MGTSMRFETLEDIQRLIDNKIKESLTLEYKSELNLDNIIFDALNLTQGERDAVYEAVINLVESRLKKAGSV